MDRASARSRLWRMTSANVEPYLNDDELDDLLVMHALTGDENGNTPEDAGYAETFDAMGLYAAAAEGWRWKANKVSNYAAWSADGRSFNPQQIREACEKRAAEYAARVGTSVGVRRAEARSEVLPDGNVVPPL